MKKSIQKRVTLPRLEREVQPHSISVPQPCQGPLSEPWHIASKVWCRLVLCEARNHRRRMLRCADFFVLWAVMRNGSSSRFVCMPSRIPRQQKSITIMPFSCENSRYRNGSGSSCASGESSSYIASALLNLGKDHSQSNGECNLEGLVPSRIMWGEESSAADAAVCRLFSSRGRPREMAHRAVL